MSRTFRHAALAPLVAFLLAAGGTGALANEALPTISDPLVAKREVELASQLRCLVCQNQSIAESNAGLAADLRKQLRQQIAAGKTDAEIVEYMTSRYGDFVLYKPPVKASTLLLWAGPVLLLAIGVFAATRMMRARQIASAAELSQEDRARAEQLLAGAGKGTTKT